jgi:hypothetical protein
MSKLCEGIKLQPILGSVLMNSIVSPTPPVPAANRYVPPSKRSGTEEQTHTQINIDTQSETLFPSLAPVKSYSSPTKPAWGKPKTANPTPLNFKATVETQIANEKREREGRLIEQEEDKFEGGEEAWATLSLKSESHNTVNHRIFEDEDYWNAKTKWAILGFRNSLEEIDRNFKDTQCVWIGGEEIERTPSSEPDWFSARNAYIPNLSYHENKETSRDKLLAFIGRKKQNLVSK